MMPTKCLYAVYTLKVFVYYVVLAQVLGDLSSWFQNVAYSIHCVFIAIKKPKRLISSSPGSKNQHISNCNQNKQGTDSEFSPEASKCNFRVWEGNLLNEIVCVTALTRCTFHCQAAWNARKDNRFSVAIYRFPTEHTRCPYFEVASRFLLCLDLYFFYYKLSIFY